MWGIPMQFVVHYRPEGVEERKQQDQFKDDEFQLVEAMAEDCYGIGKFS